MAQPTAEIRAERRRLRALRLALPRADRIAAESAIAGALRRLRIFRRGRRVAIYLAMPGEARLRGALDAALDTGVQIYVPKVTSRRLGRMRFVRLRRDCTLRPNAAAFGILEPEGRARDWSPPQRLDVILVPVLGFDRDGNRLGMGAGYYDRALRQRRDRTRCWRRPRLVGIAFACQEVAGIEPCSWDVGLDLIVTECEVIVPRRAAAAASRQGGPP
jgi:5-formyltetrahydrofolate cyclo-ligase